MTEYTKKDERDMLRKELREYEAAIGYITPDGRNELREWVAAGSQAICNLHLLHGENGNPLDFITARRICEDMAHNPGDYFTGPGPDLCTDTEEDDAPPF